MEIAIVGTAFVLIMFVVWNYFDILKDKRRKQHEIYLLKVEHDARCLSEEIERLKRLVTRFEQVLAANGSKEPTPAEPATVESPPMGIFLAKA